MGILDSGNEEPQAKLRRWIVSGVVFALLLTLAIWYAVRFVPEKRVVTRFFDAVVAGEFQRAYQIWHPQPSYTFKDFMDDWGPAGYYGPVKSYSIESAGNPRKGGSGVIVTIDISPDEPFPQANDVARQRRTRIVRLWVEKSDKSIGFPP